MTEYVLRDYQAEAVESVFDSFDDFPDDNPLVVAPTGAGKSLIQAFIQIEAKKRWPYLRMLLLSHVQELIEQNAEKVRDVWPQAPLGICAAGLNRHEPFMDMVFGMIQSVYKKADEFGHVDLVFIDEAHLISPKDETMYQTFLGALKERNPNIRFVGLTATPFRLDSGMITEGENRLFTRICYEIPIRQLIDAGYLVPPTTHRASVPINLDGVRTRQGDFATGDMDKALMEIIDGAMGEIVAAGQERECWLIFTPSIDSARYVCENLRDITGERCEYISGKTGKTERKRILEDTKNGKVKALVNCQTLTTGVDIPRVDMLCLLRATKSVSLYIQIIGRGLRLFAGKEDCLVLDFGGNVKRHGPMDHITVTTSRERGDGKNPFNQSKGKECPMCPNVVAMASRTCDACGYRFPFVPKIEREATRQAIMTAQIQPEWVNVVNVNYRVHHKKGSPPSLKVNYQSDQKVNLIPVEYNEWVAIESTNRYAREKAKIWFEKRGLDMPATASGAFNERIRYPSPKQIRVRKRPGDKYYEVIGHRFG